MEYFDSHSLPNRLADFLFKVPNTRIEAFDAVNESAIRCNYQETNPNFDLLTIYTIFTCISIT